MVLYGTVPHFRILKFPLIKWSFNREHDDSPEDLGQTNGVCGHNLGWYFVAYGSFRNGTSTTTRESMEMFFVFLLFGTWDPLVVYRT
jgi:hypothetical protein